MYLKNLVITLCTLFSLAFLAPSHAATVTYMVNQSNSLADGVDYLAVTLTEADGRLDIWVEPQAALTGIAGGNFGIQTFALQLADGVKLSRDAFDLPDDWWVQFDKNMSEFGRFDVRLRGAGRSRMDPLHFSIAGLGIDDIDPSFASHTAGFDQPVSSAFFAGDTLVPPALVPVPAAFWLFGSGLIGLAGMARRRRH